MGKKYIIAGIIVIAAFIGFIIYNNNRTEEYVESINKTKYTKIVEVSKTIPTAGFTHIGKALKQYYEVNKKYPETLMELYPEYMPSKELIEEIEWHYELKGDDFILTKTVSVNNSPVVASMDKAFRPRTGIGIMVASRSDTILAPRDETAIPAVPVKPRDLISLMGTGVERKEEPKVIKTLRPEIVSRVKADIRSGVSSDISEKFLVWKDENGNLGFGNSIYPIESRLQAYAGGEWLTVKTLLPKKEKTGQLKEKTMDSDDLARNYGTEYLVWRDKNGNLGFGNQSYPDKQGFSVYSQDTWIAMKSSTGEQPQESRTPPAPPPKKGPDELARSYGSEFLVWRDKNGNLGFGNQSYPDKEELTVYSEDAWVSMGKPTEKSDEKKQASLTGTDDRIGTKPLKKAPDELAENYSRKFLVWKDKNGNLGFGNQMYPDRQGLSVYSQDQWIAMKQTAETGQKTLSEPDKAPAAITPDELAKQLSATFLVWKDKNGNIGYGNTRYPDKNDIAYICVNGDWQKVTH